MTNCGHSWCDVDECFVRETTDTNHQDEILRLNGIIHKQSAAIREMGFERNRIQTERDDWHKLWKEVLNSGYEMKARAEKAEEIVEHLQSKLDSILDIVKTEVK